MVEVGISENTKTRSSSYTFKAASLILCHNLYHHRGGGTVPARWFPFPLHTLQKTTWSLTLKLSHKLNYPPRSEDYWRHTRTPQNRQPLLQQNLGHELRLSSWETSKLRKWWFPWQWCCTTSAQGEEVVGGGVRKPCPPCSLVDTHHRSSGAWPSSVHKEICCL